MACRRTLDAWDRQRGYNQWALEALGNSTEVSPADMQSMISCMHACASNVQRALETSVMTVQSGLPSMHATSGN